MSLDKFVPNNNPSSGDETRRAGEALRPLRRSQEVRSSQARLKLCESAIEALAEVGYERLTTALIAQRAEVSKGALAHHYPKKDDLLVAAFKFMLDRWQERREAFVRQQGTNGSMDDLLRYLWRDVFGRTDYVASLEMMLAAQHHPELRTRLQVQLATWTGVRDKMLMQVLPLDAPVGEKSTFLQLNFCFLRGLALFRMLEDDSQIEGILQMWVAISSEFLAHRAATRNRLPTKVKP